MNPSRLILAAALLASSALAEVERIWITHQAPDNSKIVISWETSEPGDSVVEFGTSPQLGESAKVDGVTYYNSSLRGGAPFRIDPAAAFSDKAASYQLLTLDREASTLKSELKALDDGRVLDTRTFTKRTAE